MTTESQPTTNPQVAHAESGSQPPPDSAPEQGPLPSLLPPPESVVALERLDRWEAQLRRYGEVMEQLHEHNDAIRRTTMEQIQEPVFRDLIKLVEDYRALALGWSERAGDTVDAQRICADVVEDLTNLLDRYGVEQVAPLPGLPFDRHLYRAVGTVETRDQGQHETIQSTRVPGYRLGQRTLRYPQVVVFRHSPLPHVSSQAKQSQQAEAEQDSQSE